MPTFYAPGLHTGQLTYLLPEDESKHAIRVLRLGLGDAVELVNGRGSVFQATVAQADTKRCDLRLVAEQQLPPRPYYTHVAVAPTKNLDRMEWLVEKAVEVGIERLTFLRCARSERRDLKLDRLEKIAVSALKQSGQAWLPQLDELVDFEKFLPTLDPATTFIAHLEDFTPAEIALCLSRGIRPVTLGASRLRTETAALAAVFTAQVVREAAA
jgi:16S rRNA (uracil1498-N3)-methyltransferase